MRLITFVTCMLLLSVNLALGLSAYTINGIGWPLEGVDAIAAGRAGAGAIGYQDGPNYSLLNPAILTIVKKNSLELTYLTDYRIIETSMDKDHNNAHTLPVASFTWVLSPKFISQISLQPLLVTSYGLETIIRNNDQDVTMQVKGEGSVNLGSLSFGYKVNENLGLGIALDYYLGSIAETWTKTYPDENYRETSDNINLSWQMRPAIRLGVLNRYKNIQLGAYYRTEKVVPVKEVKKADYGELSLSRQVSSDYRSYTMPASFGFGIAYELFEEFRIISDFSYTWWSNFRIDGKEANFQNEPRVSLGIELGKYDPLGIELRERIPLRFGVSYRPWYYTGLNNDYNVKEYIFATGTSYPMISEQPMDVALQFVYHEGEPVTEYGFRLVFGINASELWKLKSDAKQ